MHLPIVGSFEESDPLAQFCKDTFSGGCTLDEEKTLVFHGTEPVMESLISRHDLEMTKTMTIATSFKQ